MKEKTKIITIALVALALIVAGASSCKKERNFTTFVEVRSLSTGLVYVDIEGFGTHRLDGLLYRDIKVKVLNPTNFSVTHAEVESAGLKDFVDVSVQGKNYSIKRGHTLYFTAEE